MDITEINQNYPLALLLSAEDDVKRIEKMLNKGRCFVASENGNTVGAYILREPKKNPAAEISIIVIDENARGKGIARLLLRDAESRVKQDGYRFLQKQTPSPICPVAKLCAACGYTEDAETPNLWKKEL